MLGRSWKRKAHFVGKGLSRDATEPLRVLRKGAQPSYLHFFCCCLFVFLLTTFHINPDNPLSNQPDSNIKAKHRTLGHKAVLLPVGCKRCNKVAQEMTGNFTLKLKVSSKANSFLFFFLKLWYYYTVISMCRKILAFKA